MTRRIINADRLVTGIGGTVIAEGSVAVDADRVTWVGPTRELPEALHDRAAETITLPDATLLPGLIDAHTHLTLGAGHRPAAEMDTMTDGEIADTMIDAAHRFLSVGVTTVRDLGAPRYIDSDTLIGLGDGPRILLSTIPLTTPGGHCHALGGEVTRDKDIARIIDANAVRGARWIKIMVTGGFTADGASSPYHPQFTDAQLAFMVTTAHDHGLPVAAHAHGTTGIRQAVDAGVDTLEHCTWMTPDGFDLNLSLIRRIADKQITVCPTINHAAQKATGRLPWSIRRDHLQVMVNAGVRLIAGSDSGIPHSPHHLYPQSLAAYTDLGLTPLEVIETATGHTAQALGIGTVTGTLAAAKAADIIAVIGDPTTDLTVLVDPVLIMAGGRLHHLTPTVTRDPDGPGQKGHHT